MRFQTISSRTLWTTTPSQMITRDMRVIFRIAIWMRSSPQWATGSIVGAVITVTIRPTPKTDSGIGRRSSADCSYDDHGLKIKEMLLGVTDSLRLTAEHNFQAPLTFPWVVELV